MITKEEKQFILKYVDATHYDQEKLIKYLNMHDIVGNEIFSYCDKRAYRKDQPTYSTWLDDEDGYVPLSVSDFIVPVMPKPRMGHVPGQFHSTNTILLLRKRCGIDGSRKYGDIALYFFSKFRKARYRRYLLQFGICLLPHGLAIKPDFQLLDQSVRSYIWGWFFPMVSLLAFMRGIWAFRLFS